MRSIDKTFRFLYDNRDGKHADRNTPHRIKQKYIEEVATDVSAIVNPWIREFYERGGYSSNGRKR